jgi:hypothetical protein
MRTLLLALFLAVAIPARGGVPSQLRLAYGSGVAGEIDPRG